MADTIGFAKGPHGATYSAAISERLGFTDQHEDLSVEKFSVSSTTTNSSCRLEYRNGSVHKVNNNLFHRNGTTKLNGVSSQAAAAAKKTENEKASLNYIDSINLNGGNCLTTALTSLNYLKTSSTSQDDAPSPPNDVNKVIANGNHAPAPSPVQSPKPSVKTTQWTPPPTSPAQTLSLLIISFYVTAMAAIGIVSAEDWLAFLLISAQLGVIALIVLALINYRAFYIVYKTVFRDIKGGYRYLKLLICVKIAQRSNSTVQSLFARNVKKHPNRICFYFEDEEWTFKQVDEFSNKVANYFTSQGLRKGDSVALFMENRPQYVCFWLGLCKVGVIPALINFNLRREPLKHSIKVANSKLVIYGHELASAVQEVLGLGEMDQLPLFCSGHKGEALMPNAIDLDDVVLKAPNSVPTPSEPITFTDKLVYIYTSGTTGLPKAAVIKHSRCIFAVMASHVMGGLHMSDVLYAPLPLYHTVGGILGVGQALVFGNSVVLRKKFSASSFWNDCVKYNVTVGMNDNKSITIKQIQIKQFLFFTMGIHYFIGVSNNEIIYDPLPLYHTAGGMIGVGQALVHGCSTVLRKRFSASSYWQDCARYRCTAAQYIGEICRYLLTAPKSANETNHRVRLMFGNGLRPQIWKDFVKRFNIKIVSEFYGATEGNCNIININNHVGAVGFISRIAPFVYPVTLIKVDEATGEPLRDPRTGLVWRCRPNEEGELVGRIVENHPVREFQGYADSTSTSKKIVRNVFRKGDAAFRTGDILVMDDFGYFYFKDRTGDTFRWKGENVSTSEVEAVVSNACGLKDAVVYGVEVPESEGRAGMAAILDPKETLDFEHFIQVISKSLPPYARPVFLRIVKQMDMTGTYKMKKIDLQKEGFDITKITDKLYVFNDGKYIPITNEVYTKLMDGKMRL